MFARASNASKAAFIAWLSTSAGQSFDWIDCQIMNPHLASLGAHHISTADVSWRQLESAMETADPDGGHGPSRRPIMSRGREEEPMDNRTTVIRRWGWKAPPESGWRAHMLLLSAGWKCEGPFPKVGPSTPS